MRRTNLIVIAFIAGVSTAFGQQIAIGSGPGGRLDASVGYTFINANAPPGQADYFGVSGGYAAAGFRINNWLSAEGKVTGGHANDISLLGQNLTLFTFLAGPKVTFHKNRWVPFGQVLLGGAHGSDSYFPTASSSSPSASSWAYSAGGGLDMNLTDRFAIRAMDAEFLRTALPNGENNAQNHLVIGVGVVMKFGERESGSSFVAAPAIVNRPPEIEFTCNTTVPNLDEGQIVEIVGHTATEPDHLQVAYSWSSTGGNIEGIGRRVIINTSGMAAGTYQISGKVALASSQSTTADCHTAFHINAKPIPAPEAVAIVVDPHQAAEQAKAEEAKQDLIFHANVPDALFDYDSSEIRPDGEAAVQHAAQYLKANPSIHVRIEGYADERGSSEYNLALGEKRAYAARNALIAAGVDPDRLQIISFGKEAQVCAEENEACWQQNRRAAFSMHP